MMRMKGHAQHDSADYVPKEMFDYWKARDPIARYEKYLTENKLWDAKTKAELDARIEKLLDEDQEFAENSPFPPPELAEQGVYCEGCHTIAAKWERPIEEVTPPRSGVRAEWAVEDFGGLEEGMAELSAAAGRNSPPVIPREAKDPRVAESSPRRFLGPQTGTGNDNEGKARRATKPARKSKAKVPVRSKGRK
jgi:hypothetical protein